MTLILVAGCACCALGGCAVLRPAGVGKCCVIPKTLCLPEYGQIWAGEETPGGRCRLAEESCSVAVLCTEARLSATLYYV